jgi:hypothetical protein
MSRRRPARLVGLLIVADQCPQHVFFPFRVFLLPVPTVWFMKVYAIRGR